jgi:hypothetical protein
VNTSTLTRDLDTALTPLRLNPAAVSWLEVDGEIIALQLSSSEYLSTNATGALLWKSLTSGTTREELIAQVVEAYGIDQQRAAADTDAFLEALAAQGLLAV